MHGVTAVDAHEFVGDGLAFAEGGWGGEVDEVDVMMVEDGSDFVEDVADRREGFDEAVGAEDADG